MTGLPVTRVDGRLKVTGRARYAADADVDGVVFAALVDATIARGTVESVFSAAALGLPEVLGVMDDFTGLTLPYDPRHVAAYGQTVAVVIATTLEAAAHGASLVDVRYAEHRAVTDIESSDAVPRPSTTNPAYSRGDPDAALQSAAAVADLRFSLARNNHNPMEINGTVARWEGDRLTVWDKVQSVSTSRADYAQALAIPEDHVQVISPFVGGAFGNAGWTWPHQLLAAHTARRIGRPVKLVLTRRQLYHVTGYRPTSRQRVTIGADATGHLTAIVHEGDVELSRYRPYEDNLTEPAKTLYRAPSMRSTLRVVELDVNPGKHMRGPGHVSGAFALESTLDDLAHRLGIDPVELRLRNEPDRDPESDMPFSTRRLAECLRSGAAAFGWDERDPIPRSVRDGDDLIGMGMAAAGFPTLVSPCAVAASILADGSAVVSSGTSDVGPGTPTAMSQVAADALGLPLHRVRFRLGDSRLPVAPPQNGSRTMASVGSAVHNAGMLLRDRFIRTAVVDPGSPLHGARPGDVDVVNGAMVLRGDPTRTERYEDLLRRRRLDQLAVEARWTPGDSSGYSAQAYGAVFAEVAVDVSLGTVRVRRMFGSYDAGHIVNPLLAHSQAIGGMVGGIGMALLEATHLDHRDGRIVNANLADYLVPVNADVVGLDAEFLMGQDTIADPLGVKGIGELVIVAVPAAIANAVFNATGRRITNLPISLDQLR